MKRRTFEAMISDHARDDILQGRPNVIGAFIANPEHFIAHRAVTITLTLDPPKQKRAPARKKRK